MRRMCQTKPYRSSSHSMNFIFYIVNLCSNLFNAFFFFIFTIFRFGLCLVIIIFYYYAHYFFFVCVRFFQRLNFNQTENPFVSCAVVWQQLFFLSYLASAPLFFCALTFIYSIVFIVITYCSPYAP